MNTKNILKILFIASAVLVLGALYFVVSKYDTNNMPGTGNTNISNQQQGPGLPVQLTIPSIGVDAKIINVGLASDGSVGVPKGPSDVAWFQLGARPGEKGSAIITGHYGPWRSGAHSVFDNLDKLQKGDKIYVKDDRGISYSFVVRETSIYNSNESPKEVFNKQDGTYLNLITCNGDWIASQKTYTKRLVVFTDAVPE